MARRLSSLPPRLNALDMRRARPPAKTADPFYLSSEWRSLLKRLIARRGRRCEDCGKTHEDDGSPVRLIGDHIVERRDGGADLDERNIRLLCARSGGDGRTHADGSLGGCHARKTAAAAQARLHARL